MVQTSCSEFPLMFLRGIFYARAYSGSMVDLLGSVLLGGQKVFRPGGARFVARTCC